MNRDILGLSHLVFTISKSDFGTQFFSSLLDKHYDQSVILELDHSEHRHPLLRDVLNSKSHITLFKSKFSDLPAIELLHVETFGSRPLENYGLFISGIADHLPAQKIYKFRWKDYFIDYFIDELLNCAIAVDTNFINQEIESGAWLYVNDFDDQRQFFTQGTSAKVILESSDILIVRCKVLNKKFSNFIFVLIRNNQSSCNYYNDDLGLSTLGWIAKDLKSEEVDKLFRSSTKIFSLEVNDNQFEAKFLFNSKNISHEILKPIKS